MFVIVLVFLFPLITKLLFLASFWFSLELFGQLGQGENQTFGSKTAVLADQN